MEPTDGLNTYLNPSELGTKDYWDNYYQNDLDNDEDDYKHPTDVSELESWFDDVGAPSKTLAFLTSKSFPLSPTSLEGPKSRPSVLDVGTGNGSALLSLHLEGCYQGSMVGIDYSEQSIKLARRLRDQYNKSESKAEAHGSGSAAPISFEIFDVIRDDARATSWWPSDNSGFDLILDKGTFDAISLSSETVVQSDRLQKRIAELYPSKIANMIKAGGFFLITSCNWTQDEIICRFTSGTMQGILEVYHIIKYPVFQFGGQKGQGVVSICFRKAA